MATDGWWQPELYVSRLEALADALNATMPPGRVPLTGATTTLLVTQLLKAQARALQTCAATLSGGCVRLPSALLRDLRPGGGLFTTLRACLSFATALTAAQQQQRGDVARDMLAHVRAELVAAGAVPALRVRFAEDVPAEQQAELQAVVARLGGAVVGEGAGEAPATHTLQAVPPAEPPAGEEYFRVVEARHSGARAPAATHAGRSLLHVCGTPDSADAWVPALAAPAGGAGGVGAGLLSGGFAQLAPPPPPGGWRLPLAWLLSSAAANELLPEADFDLSLGAGWGAGRRKRPRTDTATPSLGAPHTHEQDAKRPKATPPEPFHSHPPPPLPPGTSQRPSIISPPELHHASAGDGFPAAGTRCENLSSGQRPVNAPPPSAPPSGPLPTSVSTRHFLPAFASWFSFNTIHDTERRGLPEFFTAPAVAQGSKTASTYRTMRNAIVARFRENPNRRITFTECRQSLVGDVSALSRIFGFLEHWGVINNMNSKAGAAAHARLAPAAAAALAAVPEHGVPVALRMASGAGASRPKHALYDFDVLRGSALPPAVEAASLAVRRGLVVGAPVACNACGCDVTSQPRYHCVRLPDYDLCGQHYAEGRFVGGLCSADFLRLDPEKPGDGAPFGASANRWKDTQTLMLLEAIELHGDNWDAIAKHVGTKSKAQCLAHFLALPIEDRFLDDMEGRPLSLDGAGAAAPAQLPEDRPELVPFEDAGNPILAQVAFLAAVVGPRVAAAAAAAALAALESEMCGGAAEPDDVAAAIAAATRDSSAAMETDTAVPADGAPSAAAVRRSAAVCLAGAAVKAKLLADQEERDLHRTVVGILDTQAKKLEVKLRQLDELDELLRREGDATDGSRTMVVGDRVMATANKIQALPPQQQAQALVQQPAARQ